jgi:hypothetical protein
MMHQSVCECGQGDCPTDTGFFYASIRREGGDFRLMLGPFPTHAEALAAVDLARELAERSDARAHWYAYGTCRTTVAYAPIFVPCLECGEIRYYRAAACPCAQTNKTEAA